MLAMGVVGVAMGVGGGEGVDRGGRMIMTMVMVMVVVEYRHVLVPQSSFYSVL